MKAIHTALILFGVIFHQSGVAFCERTVRKVLPLDHHQQGKAFQREDGTRPYRNLVSKDASSVEHDNRARNAHSGVGGSVSVEGDNRSRGGGQGGFLGDGLNSIMGRNAHSGNGNSFDSGNGHESYRSGNSREDNKPTGLGPKEKTHSPVYYSSGDTPHFPPALSPDQQPSAPQATQPSAPAVHPAAPEVAPVYHPSKGKGKGKSKSKSSKSKSKSKKSKGKGKGHSSSEDPAGSPIDGDYGADKIQPGDKDSTDGESKDPGQPTEPPEQANEVVINLTPFGILYDLEDGMGTPSSDDYALAIEVTIGYLNTYISLQYEGQGITEFQTTATSTIYRDGVPQIDFIASATFVEGQEPSLEELDNNIQQAFSGANLALYLSMLQNLPPENPFSGVSGARLTSPASMGRSSGFIASVSTVGKAGLAGAIGAGTLILIAVGFMVYGNRRRPSRIEHTRLTASDKMTTAPIERSAFMEEEETYSDATTSLGSESGSGLDFRSNSREARQERISFLDNLNTRSDALMEDDELDDDYHPMSPKNIPDDEMTMVEEKKEEELEDLDLND